MQTFLPYPDFARSAACLDYRRLGKQRVECLQIHRAALLAKDPAWYGQYGWKEEPKIEYWWPTKEIAA
jgi:hypothetical protein